MYFLCYSLQERLLLSLLPAHIARVMKAEIIQRLKGPNFGQIENTNNFHNLYVQRHTNVRHVDGLTICMALLEKGLFCYFDSMFQMIKQVLSYKDNMTKSRFFFQ